MIPPATPGPFEDPISIDLGRTTVAGRVDVATVWIGDDIEQATPPGSPVFPVRGAALVLNVVVHPGHEHTYLIPRRSLERGAFARIAAGVEETLWNDELLAARHAAATQANIAAGNLPGTPPTCPVCGRRIFGNIAARGACVDCLPTVPAAAAAELGTPEAGQ